MSVPFPLLPGPQTLMVHQGTPNSFQGHPFFPGGQPRNSCSPCLQSPSFPAICHFWKLRMLHPWEGRGLTATELCRLRSGPGSSPGGASPATGSFSPGLTWRSLLSVGAEINAIPLEGHATCRTSSLLVSLPSPGARPLCTSNPTQPACLFRQSSQLVGERLRET